MAQPRQLLYSAVDARLRYEDSTHSRLWYMSHAEAGGFYLGAPPWKDPNRYIRNSPITYVDKVLIVQGDMDQSPIQQGEEFFMSLYRQNKRAEFVRYWGEEHVISSPPNFLDMWKRIYAWFDQFLRAEDAAH